VPALDTLLREPLGIDDPADLLERMYLYGDDRQTAVLHRLRMLTFWRLMQAHRSELSHQPGLDAGCSGGAYCRMLARLGCASVWGIDIDRKALERAGRALWFDPRMNGRNCYVFKALDLCRDAPGRGDCFGIVVCSEVLEEVAKPLVVLQHLRDVVRPGGLLAVSVPNRNSLFYLAQRLAYPRAGLGARRHSFFPADWTHRLLRLEDSDYPHVEEQWHLEAWAGVNLLFDSKRLRWFDRGWIHRLNLAVSYHAPDWSQVTWFLLRKRW